jgi:RNA polymerase sigma-70 factor (ECF subfamily)
VTIASLPNEKDILLRIAKGDTVAFGIVFNHYYDHLYTVALIYTKVHELAEDIVQQVFLRLWEKRASLTGVCDLESYLFISTRNEIVNCMRKQVVRRKYIVRIKEMFEEESGTPEQDLIARQRTEAVQKAIQQLPPKQQQVWKLSREKGLSYEDIAAQLGIAIPTVKGHVSSALRSIRQFLTFYRHDLFILLAVAARFLFN